MQWILEKIIPWIKNNSGRLLLYAVIITGCFSIKFAAYGKYVDYVRDYTSVVSAPFYFSSNYLGEEFEQKSYTMGLTSSKNIAIDLEIRNNDNAFNFNGEGTDFYYYVTAELYRDENYTQPYTGTSYTTLIKYGENNEYAAAMATEVKTEDGYRYIKIDNSYNEYNEDGEYKVLGRIDGLPLASGSQSTLPMADTKNYGKQTVNILIQYVAGASGFQEQNLYLRIKGYVVPPATGGIAKIDTSYIPQQETLFPEGYINAFTQSGAFPDVLSGYSSAKGIYASELVCDYKLTKSGSSGELTITRQMRNDAVTYQVFYIFNSSQDVKDVRLRYDSSVLKCNESGTVYSQKKIKTSGAGYYDKYLKVDLVEGLNTFSFNKLYSIQDTVSEHDVNADPDAN